MSWYILTENQSVALPFYLENTNHQLDLDQEWYLNNLYFKKK